MKLKKTYVKLFMGYCLIVLLLALYNTFLVLSGVENFSQVYNSFLVSGFSVLDYFVFSIGVIAFLLSVILVVLIYSKKLAKSYLVLPVYYIFYYFGWGFLLTLGIGLYYGSQIIAIEFTDQLSRYDIIFYVLNIVLSTYFLYKLYKENNP